ncbi:MAG: NADH-quinone oxidoreductase subunit K [Candidatus Cloacimonetes bacterium]|nr:NADH-quinone oxidoreductase subunit K [Candidatus Cloacimonadota bacterium]
MIVLITGFLLMLIGIWAMLSRKHLIRIVIGFAIVDTGINLVIVALGYVKGKTAPIIDRAVSSSQGAMAGVEAVGKVVDPIPSALVLTAIVIGLAVTALMLAYVIRLNNSGKSLNIDDFGDQKW